MHDTNSTAPPGRQAAAWSTPIKPVADGRLWCVWETGGVYEWFAHPNHAAWLLEHGIRIDGELCAVEKLADWPGLGVQIRAWKHTARHACV